MISIKANLATLYGTGFTSGIGGTYMMSSKPFVRFSTETSFGDIPLTGGRSDWEDDLDRGVPLQQAIPLVSVDPSKATPTITAFMPGSPTGIGVLAARSKALRLDRGTELDWLSNFGHRAPVLWSGGEGVGLPHLQIRRPGSEDRYDVFVMREGQWIVVVDTQRRMGRVRFSGDSFQLLDLTPEYLFHHVTARALMCTTIKEARWCEKVLLAAGFSDRLDVASAKRQMLELIALKKK